MVNLVREMNIPFGVVINKANFGDRKVYEYLHEENIEILGEIPFSRSYAVQYAKGEIFTDVPDEIEEAYQKLIHNLTEKVAVS